MISISQIQIEMREQWLVNGNLPVATGTAIDGDRDG